MPIEIALEPRRERRREKRLVGHAGLHLVGREDDPPAAADFHEVPAELHHREVLEPDRAVGEQGDHEAVAVADGPAARRPVGGSIEAQGRRHRADDRRGLQPPNMRTGGTAWA